MPKYLEELEDATDDKELDVIDSESEDISDGVGISVVVAEGDVSGGKIIEVVIDIDTVVDEEDVTKDVDMVEG